MKSSIRDKCPCCKECKECTTGFQKVVDLKNAGLVIYRHTAHTEDVNKDTGIIEYATKTTEDVYILHNTKDMELTSADYLPEIEQSSINCPRCRRIIEHAQKLLQKVPKINRNDVKGICEHCRTKRAPCFECEEVVKKFVTRKSEQSENTKERVKQWLSKIKHLLKDDSKTDREKVRAHSELYIDQLCRESPKLGREPEVKQMFPPGTNFVGAFPPSIEKRKKMFAHFPKLEKLESPVVFLDPPRKVGKPFVSTSRTKEAIDIIYGDKVYVSDADSIDLGAMFHAPLTEKEKQKQEKLVDLRVPPVPFHSEEDFILGKVESITEFEKILNATRHNSRYYPSDEEPDAVTITNKVAHRRDRTQRRETFDLRPETQAYARKLQQSKPDQRARLDIKLSLDSAKATNEKEIHGKTVESPNIIRKYHSEEALLTKIADVTEDVIKQDFSYVFPKILSPDKKKLKRQKSSSELIKATQDMLLAKAEKENKRMEEERKKKLEDEERKRIAREQKKQQQDDKSKAHLERKLLEVPQKEIEKSMKKVEKEKPKTEKVTPTASTATSKKKSRPALEKNPKEPKESKKSKQPNEPKEPNELKEPKRDKDAEKAKKDLEKEERLKKDLEKKEKEERLKKEKEERLKKEKEEKERLKKEKEEQLRKEREMKQKEKEELQQEKGKGDKQKVKEKVDPSSKLKDQEDKAVRAEKDAAEKRAREEAKLLLMKTKEADVEVKQEPEKPKVSKKTEEPNTKDLNIKSIKVNCGPSPDDLILQLVKFKKSDNNTKPKELGDLGLTTKAVKTHTGYHKYKKPACIMCVDSDVELDAQSIIMRKDEVEMAEIIIGPKIFKYKPPLIDRRDDQDIAPLFFQSTFDEAKLPDVAKDVATSPKISPVPASGKQVQGKHAAEQEAPKGVIRYALSDRAFIDKGWTMLPTEKVVRKMNVYRMRPAQPEFDWFEHNKNKRLMLYDSGEKLAEFDDNGRGRWFYKNGRMALDYYDAEELNAQQRFVIYSSGDPDERGRAQPYTLLATFDYLGNGIVFDHSGKIRLKYNQTEGVVLDRSIGPVSHWKWHTLNDPPVLQQVMIDTQMAHKDPSILKLGGPHDNKTRPDNEDMLAIEFDNFIKEKSKKLTQIFKPFQIKMKALKINEHFSLKVLDQATVYLIFRDGTTNLKLNIGMVLDHKEIVDTDTAEVGEVSNNMERLPARTDSLAGLQKSIAHAQHYERMRTERERRLCTAAPSGSTDKLTAAASRPMRLPLRVGPSASTAATNSFCKCSRKPIASNVYYDTRFC